MLRRNEENEQRRLKNSLNLKPPTSQHLPLNANEQQMVKRRKSIEVN